jgi:hypothetical protein
VLESGLLKRGLSLSRFEGIKPFGEALLRLAFLCHFAHHFFVFIAVNGIDFFTVDFAIE